MKKRVLAMLLSLLLTAETFDLSTLCVQATEETGEVGQNATETAYDENDAAGAADPAVNIAQSDEDRADDSGEEDRSDTAVVGDYDVATDTAADELAEFEVTMEEAAVTVADGLLAGNVESEESQDIGPLAASGTQLDPIAIESGISYKQGNEDKYYKFSTEEKGCVKIYAAAESGWTILRIYENSVKDSNLFHYCESESKELSLTGEIGLRAGVDYYVFVTGNPSNASGLNFRLDFTPGEYWEEELDSPEHVKAIKTDTGEKYHGYLSKEDPGDYYSFTLSKATKVKIWEKSPEWMHYFKIYKDSSFSDIIHNGNLSDKGGYIFEKQLAAGTYYMLFEYNSSVNASAYEFVVNTSEGAAYAKKYPATGEAAVNGESVTSLKEAFSKMTDVNMDYVVEMASDMGSSDKSYEKNLVIPKTAASVTIKGDGYTIKMTGTKITANAKLTLENVTVKTMSAKGADAAFTLTAKKDLNINGDVSFATTKAKAISCSAILSLDGSLDVNKLTTASLNLGGTATLVAGSKAAITVKNKLSGENGAEIQLKEGFKPLAIKGEIGEDSVFKLTYAGVDDVEVKLKDAAQILTVNKKLSNEVLACFDVSALGGDTVGAEYALAKPAATKAALYPLAFSYNDKNYALWKDVIADASTLGSTDALAVKLNSDAYTYGALKLPKAGKYASISIDGDGHTLSFTGNVKLTAPMMLKDITLHGQTAKGVDKAYKITEVPKKNYTLTRENVTAGNIVFLPTIKPDGSYTKRDDVALYLHNYGKLPGNFITKIIPSGPRITKVIWPWT